MDREGDQTNNSTLFRNTESSILRSVSNISGSQRLHESPEETKQTKDHRKAWIVCFSSFCVQVIIMGNLHVFGIYYISFLNEFKASKAKTAWVGSLAYGIGMMFAPVASSVINKHGPHISVALGVTFCCVSLFVSSTANSLNILFLAYSLLYGLGVSFAYTPTMCIASEYFDKYLTVATGIMVAGSSTGTLVFSPVSQAWIDTIGWRNALRIHGGLVICLGFPCAYLMKPESRPLVQRTSAELIRKSMARQLMNDLQLWKNKVFLVWVSAITLVMFGYYIPYVHLVAYADDIGVPPSQGSLLIMILGAFTAIGRITFGKVMAWGYLNRLNMHQLSMVVTGTAAMLLPLIKTFTGLVCYCIFIGLVDGCYVVLLPVLTTALVGSGRDSVVAWGYLTMVSSITYTIGPPVAGFLYDSTGSYNIPFHIAGIPLLVGAVILFFIPWAQRTAETTNMMAHTYAPDENIDRDSLATEMGSIAATDRTMTPIPEIIFSVDSSSITIDLEEGESYVVPRRGKRRRRDVSICSELSGVSEVASETVDEMLRQGFGLQKLEAGVTGVPHCTGSQAASLATSPRILFDCPMRVSNPQIFLTPTREDGVSCGGLSGFTLSLASPQQVPSPSETSRAASMANSPRSTMDQHDPLSTSPPTVVKIIRQKSSNTASPDFVPIQVEVSHGTQKIVARGPMPTKTVHYKSTSDVRERDTPEQQTPRQPKVHFTSQVQVLETPTAAAKPPTNEPARKILSNPEIFPQNKERHPDDLEFHVQPRLFGRTSNPTVGTERNLAHQTNPFRPNYINPSNPPAIQTDAENIVCSPQRLSQSYDSNASTSTVVKAEEAINSTVDGDIENPQQPVSNSSSFVFVESSTLEEETPSVDLSDFDPIPCKHSGSEIPTGRSPQFQEPTRIPAIPPPPTTHTRTPRTSDSRNSDSGIFPLQQVQSAESAFTDQSSTTASSADFDTAPVGSGSRQGLDIPAGDASTERPSSPRSPDAMGIFDMTDLMLEEDLRNFDGI